MGADPTEDMAASESQASAAQSLLSQLESPVVGAPLLPTSARLWRIGVILYRPSRSSSQSPSTHLEASFRDLVDALPASYLQRYFSFFRQALVKLRAQHASAAGPSSQSKQPSAIASSLIDATSSLYGLLSVSPRSCELACSEDLLRCLASLYDHSRIKDLHERSKNTICGCLSFLLLDGILFATQSSPTTKANDSHPLETLMELIRCIEEESVDCLGAAQEWQTRSEPLKRTLESSVRLLSPSFDEDQLEYLLQMLQSAREKDAEKHHHRDAVKAAPAPTTSVQVSAADELERRIEQVQQILPDFGAGFVETALSLHQGDVERTITVLLGDRATYPGTLQVLDPKLPRRAKERSKDEAKASEEARQLVKQRVAAEAEKEQKRYEAVLYVQRQQKNEYDDDYDDQYDDMQDGGLGNLDNGWMDDGNDTNARRQPRGRGQGKRGGQANDEYEKIKMYNAYAREEEADQAFWEENRNLNRKGPPGNIQKSKKKQNGDDGQDDGDSGESGGEGEESGKKYRGPDKIKGGRVLDENGRVVRTGRRNKKKANANNNANAANTANSGGGGSGNNKTNGNAGDGRGGGAGGRGGGNGGGRGRGRGGKPRTKPKSGNRVNQRRDNKQKKQGAFGVP